LFRYFRSSIEPLFWSVEDDWRGYGPETVAFQKDLREWGYWGGVCIPIQTMNSTHGFINLATNSHDDGVIDQAIKVAFLMRYVHSHALRLWIEQHPGHTSLRARLSRREKEILLAVADGLTSQEIGEKLHLSNRTVDSHLAAVQQKLQAGNRQQVLCKAVNLGMIHAPLQFNPEHVLWIM
jgi:LuxR family transcriptional regulator